MSEEGSEDSPPRPKRKIKKVMVLSSDTSSDSDESVTAVGSRRKRLRVLSDDGSDSSGSSVVCAGARRKRALPKLRDSEGDSDTSGWATDHSDAPKPAASVSKPTSGFASDSSEGNSEKCSICLLRFTDQEVGTPQSCEHIFCLDCITEWSKNVNTCPVDRMTFDFIVVRACAGGRVLRNEPVKVVERRPSVELLVIEDPTVCEVCGRTDNEETMLLCDGCDLGYHMQCLTPPLSEVPIDQWLCPNCDNLLSDVDFLFSGITDMDIPSRSALIRETRNVRSSRTHSADEPSTSSGHRQSRLNSDDIPTTSRGTRSAQGSSSRASTSRRKPTAHTNRRRPKRRRTKTVIIEYEVQENGKFPVTKRVKRKLKKRKTKRRQPRTAARRSHVLASVRAALLATGASAGGARGGGGGTGAQELSLRRQRAGIPALSLFGDAHQLDYFSEDDEHGVSERASTAVAARPTSSILSAYRQARRKMISIPSPTHASSAPDVLSSILESQTMLHSKKSVVTISVDGSVNIKLETRENTKLPKKQSEEPKKQDKIDLSKGDDAAKKVPSYPGQSRGGRGWGGGYTGNYHREQGTNSLNSRGNYDGGYSGAGYQGRAGNAFNQNNSDDMDGYGNYSRRPHHYPHGDELFERNNRRPPPEHNRAQQNQPRHEQGRYSAGPAPAWQPYVPPPPGPRHDPPPAPLRHSFGGFENPLDMRMGPIRRQNSANSNPELPVAAQAQPAPKPQPQQQAQPYRPLPEPPMFKFDKTPDIDKSEDEKSDSSLVIDTEKYDPTEPTNDDDSGDDDGASAPSADSAPPAPPAAAAPPTPPAPAALGLDAAALGVPAGVLDSAVRAVLHEHRALLAPPPAPSADASDDDSEGDCPNFSIYSATSVHIANTSAEAPALAPPVLSRDGLEDLVQEDDDVPEPAPRAKPAPDLALRNKTEEEFKEKVSKRCPITTNPRNPIKIKLNTPSLIKRHVSLYDEEENDDEEEEVNEASESVPVAEPCDELPRDDSAAQLRDATSDQLHDTTDQLRDATADQLRNSTDHLYDNTADQCEEQADRSNSPVKADEVAALVPESDSVEPAHTNHEDSDRGQEEVTDVANDIDKDAMTPEMEEEPATPTDKAASVSEGKLEDDDDDDETMDSESRAATPPPRRRASSSDDDELSAADTDLPALDHSPRKSDADRNDDLLEKMTESISETEDERSYTPCLDENKSKDTSLETDKDKGIEGLDTEMISEDEGNEMFSDNERAPSEHSRASPAPPPPDDEEGEIVDKKKEPRADDAKKKKKKDSKKEGKDKSKAKGKKSDVAFKKLSKSGKERNYRDKDKKRERRDSSDASRERKQRRKERRKDLERYDVRTLVSEKRRRPKDAFGRDVSPRASPSLSRSPPRLTPRRSASPAPRRASPAPRRASPAPRRASPAPRRTSVSPRRRASPARVASPPRRRRRTRDKRAETRRRRSGSRARKRRRSGSGSAARPKPAKRKKRARSSRSTSRAARRRTRRRSRSASAASGAAASVDSRLLSPRTPPPEPEAPAPEERRRRDPQRHRRARDPAGPSKEVFTSGDNILVSVSFKEQERGDGESRRSRRRERRRRRKLAAAAPAGDAPRPVAIIDLERSPFRELTPSPRNVIVLSDSEPGDKEAAAPAPAPEPEAAAAPAPDEARGPLTPPEPPDSPDAYDPYEPTGSPGSARAASPPRACMTLEAAQKTNMSADEVLDRRPISPIEKVMALLQSTRDVSPEPPPGDAAAAPGPAAGASPGPAAAPPAPAPGPAPAPPVRIVLPSPTRSAPPKLFLAKPSPIKSDPIKPMQAAKLPRPAPSTAAVAARRRDDDDAEESPYSPGSSDFGDLFEPPAGARSAFDALVERPPRRKRNQAAKVPVKLNRKKGKTQVGVKIDEDNLKILDDLPSSAVEMQVKSKFLKKLNRQERVVEEVKLVLKPHYNKKHVTKDEYKDILRRAVPKICHNKTGEINPSKIQALVEAYVKKFRKKHKLGLV
ncbi:hypothetical protein PYW07_003021 [Mythimna separata]|uniref:PHD and RING finger domain-containing protein 1 n=1 Tax=Mythimna separata TaxID=271217 RepID=A0AAD8DQG8_MYTSE|nr:hypothetical protein PYW07_003021 [Mythimna separata]